MGIARAAYEFALDYAKERRQFGRPIVSNQAIAFKLADMRTQIDAVLGLLVWRAPWTADRLPFAAGEGSMSKLFAGETAVRVTDEAIQILGGYGYVRDYPVERWHRDAKIYTIFEELFVATSDQFCSGAADRRENEQDPGGRGGDRGNAGEPQARLAPSRRTLEYHKTKATAVTATAR